MPYTPSLSSAAASRFSAAASRSGAATNSCALASACGPGKILATVSPDSDSINQDIAPLSNNARFAFHGPGVCATSCLLIGWVGRDEYARRNGGGSLAQGVAHGGSLAPDADELLNVCDAVQVVAVEHDVGAFLAGVSFVCVISHIVPPDRHST